MKKIILLTGAVLLALCPVQGIKAQTDETKYQPVLHNNTPAPDFSIPDQKGKAITLKQFRGKYVVLDFWASWCGDCRRDLPVFKSIAKEYSKKVVFIGISFDKEPHVWKSFLKQNSMNWIQVCNFLPWKQNPVSLAYKLSWIPTMYIIGPDGTIQGSSIHAEKIGEQLKRLLR